MSLLSRLFGAGKTPAARQVAMIRFTYDRPRVSVRHLAEAILVEAGSYRIDLTTTGSGAYAPEGSFAPLPDGGWHHAVHLACCTPYYPLAQGAAQSDAELPHYLFHNAADPGPHSASHAARDAFRAIPEAARSFVLPEDTRLIFWIEADDMRGGGVMELRLMRTG